MYLQAVYEYFTTGTAYRNARCEQGGGKQWARDGTERKEGEGWGRERWGRGIDRLPQRQVRGGGGGRGRRKGRNAKVLKEERMGFGHGPPPAMLGVTSGGLGEEGGGEGEGGGGAEEEEAVGEGHGPPTA